MATIEPMTRDADTATGSAPAAPTTDDAQAQSLPGVDGASSRSSLVPLLATVIGALVAGVFVLAAVGFNTLRGDIAHLSSETTAEFSALLMHERFL